MPGAGVDVGALFAEHGPRILAFALRMLGNRADAEDATQETFLKAYRQAGTFSADSQPSTWLFAIARNTCLDRLRARRPRSFASLEATVAGAVAGAAVPGVVPGAVPDAGAEAERRWYVEAVREGCLLATLGCLGADQRTAFVLRVLCGMSTADTAAILGRSENATRLLVHRARTGLRAFLCRNCSLYDPANRCRCPNLVGFALAKGWIGPDDRRVPRHEAAAVAARAVAAVDEASRLAAVYASLAGPDLDPGLADRIRAALDVTGGAGAGGASAGGASAGGAAK